MAEYNDDVIEIGVGVNSPENINQLGLQLLIEMYGVDPEKLNSLSFIKRKFKKAAKKANANIVKIAFHKFKPYGISGVLVISASHMAIHTWPELGYASVEIYFCGNEGDILIAKNVLLEAFSPEKICMTKVYRGIPEEFMPSGVTIPQNYPTATRSGLLTKIFKLL